MSAKVQPNMYFIQWPFSSEPFLEFKVKILSCSYGTVQVLLVGDSDVGKQEIITGMEDGSLDSPYCSSAGAGQYIPF